MEADIVIERLSRYEQDAFDTRSECNLPERDGGPQRLVDSVVEHRGYLDRVEAILRDVIRLRGALQANLRQSRAVTEDKWDEAARSWDDRTRTSGRDYAPRERYADNNLRTLEDRRAERSAEDLASRADTAYELIRMLHYSLNDQRRDLHVIIRAMEVENQLES